MRVIAYECGDVGVEYGAGCDIGAASEVFGGRLAGVRIGRILQSGGASLIEGDQIIGELRGNTIHMDRINGVLVSVAA
jgi:hypothetical protein